MSSGWKYGKCARLKCKIIGSTAKSYLITEFDINAPQFEDYMPISQVKLSEKDGEWDYLWCTMWILGKMNINISGLAQRNTDDIIGTAAADEMPVRTEEYFSDEDITDMEQELDFSDDPSGKYYGDKRYTRFE